MSNLEELSEVLETQRKLLNRCPVQDRDNGKNYCWLLSDIACPYRSDKFSVYHYQGGEVKRYECLFTSKGKV